MFIIGCKNEHFLKTLLTLLLFKIQFLFEFSATNNV